MTEETILDEKTLFDRLTNLFNQTWELDQDLKELMGEAKEAGIDNRAKIKKVAKAVSYSKLGKTQEEAESLLETIKELNL
jgi:uncharacterized protein (UPF0335 family)